MFYLRLSSKQSKKQKYYKYPIKVAFHALCKSSKNEHPHKKNCNFMFQANAFLKVMP